MISLTYSTRRLINSNAVESETWVVRLACGTRSSISTRSTTRTLNCPIDETLDQAVERYLTKVQKCGWGLMFLLEGYCECDDCEDMRCGPMKEGSQFWAKTLGKFQI
ncbi:hypothetical protein BCR34DRAFT_572283 [Clohesyomyces aquaticus]|uniref:Uncharacterized protein n=1 Tax=Clohesyomyces aquaticus TaxID=1231657 RepID=A0A1Y1Z478_9PLEO|nr:hypothetical protein BCR34DRAFT_572283 [Clohesyomyces aquaticus]